MFLGDRRCLVWSNYFSFESFWGSVIHYHPVQWGTTYVDWFLFYHRLMRCWANIRHLKVLVWQMVTDSLGVPWIHLTHSVCILFSKPVMDIFITTIDETVRSDHLFLLIHHFGFGMIMIESVLLGLTDLIWLLDEVRLRLLQKHFLLQNDPKFLISYFHWRW